MESFVQTLPLVLATKDELRNATMLIIRGKTRRCNLCGIVGHIEGRDTYSILHPQSVH